MTIKRVSTIGTIGACFAIIYLGDASPDFIAAGYRPAVALALMLAAFLVTKQFSNSRGS